MGGRREGGRDNETEWEGGEGPTIDLGCKATAAGWRSVVWSHKYGSLQQILQATPKTRFTPCNTHSDEERVMFQNTLKSKQI